MKFESQNRILTNAPSIDSSNNLLLGANRGLQVKQVKSTYEVLDTHTDKMLYTEPSPRGDNFIDESEVRQVGVDACFNRNSGLQENQTITLKIPNFSGFRVSKSDFVTQDKTYSLQNSRPLLSEKENNSRMDILNKNGRRPTEIFDDIIKNKAESDLALMNLLQSSTFVEKNKMTPHFIGQGRGKETWSFNDINKISEVSGRTFNRSDPSYQKDQKYTKDKLTTTYRLLNAYLESENTILKEKIRVLQAKRNNYGVFKNKCQHLQADMVELRCPLIDRWMEMQAFVRGNIENPAIKKLKDQINNFENKSR